MKKDIMKKGIFPLIVALLLAAILYPICTGSEGCDYRLLCLLMGIPYGIHKLIFVVLPARMDGAEMIGVILFYGVLCGFIGFFIMLRKIVMAVIYLALGIVIGISWLAGRNSYIMRTVRSEE